MFQELDTISDKRKQASKKPLVVQGISTDRNALPEKMLVKHFAGQYFPIVRPIYFFKDVTETNSHLIAQKDEDGNCTEAFKLYRTSAGLSTSNSIQAFIVSASNFAKATGLLLKPAAKFFKNTTFGKLAQYVEFEDFVNGKTKNFNNFQTDWGNEHEPNAIANVMLKCGVKVCQCGMKRGTIDESLGIYCSATPDFCWEHPDIEGLMGTGEAKARSPIIVLDDGVVLNMSGACEPFDEIPYYYVLQVCLQAHLFRMIYCMFTSWSEEKGNTTFLFELDRELIQMAFDLIRFVVQKYMINKVKYNANTMEDPFEEVKDLHRRYLNQIAAFQKSAIQKMRYQNMETKLLGGVRLEKRKRLEKEEKEFNYSKKEKK